MGEELERERDLRRERGNLRKEKVGWSSGARRRRKKQEKKKKGKEKEKEKEKGKGKKGLVEKGGDLFI